MFLWYSSNTYHINTSTNSYYSWSVHTTLKPWNFAYTIIYILIHAIYMTTYIWYWWPDFVTFHPSCAYFFLVWYSNALLIFIVYHPIQFTKYARVLTYRNFFLYTTWDDLAGPVPAPHITRFVVRSDEPINSNMADLSLGRRSPF